MSDWVLVTYHLEEVLSMDEETATGYIEDKYKFKTNLYKLCMR